MAEITLDILHAVCPYAKKDRLQAIADAFNTHAAEYGITTELRICHFFAQAAEETDHFNTMQEYASGAEYEGRHDLGNVNAGDGRWFKGRGIFQTTGRANYTLAAKRFGITDLLEHPEKLEQPELAVQSALYYWDSHGLSEFADADDCETITRRINGGLNGFDERQRLLGAFKAQFGI